MPNITCLLDRHRAVRERLDRAMAEQDAARLEVAQIERDVLGCLRGRTKPVAWNGWLYSTDGFRVTTLEFEPAEDLDAPPAPTLDNFGGETADEMLDRLRGEYKADEERLLATYRAVEATPSEVSRILQPNGAARGPE